MNYIMKISVDYFIHYWEYKKGILYNCETANSENKSNRYKMINKNYFIAIRASLCTTNYYYNTYI